MENKTILHKTQLEISITQPPEFIVILPAREEEKELKPMPRIQVNLYEKKSMGVITWEKGPMFVLSKSSGHWWTKQHGVYQKQRLKS